MHGNNLANNDGNFPKWDTRDNFTTVRKIYLNLVGIKKNTGYS